MINHEPDATFPAHPPDPSRKENLKELISLVKTAQTPTIGIALDGDADRVTLILEDGTHLSGDDLLALLARPVLQKYPGTHIVYDIKSSSRLTKTVQNACGIGHFSPCGHPYIQNGMKTQDALLGGEVSGHLFFKDRYFGFDDGIYGMLRILGLAVNARTSLTKLFAELRLRTQCLSSALPATIGSL